MDPAFFIAIVLGAGPALLSMYFVLRNYQGAFDERKVFLALAGGMILGLVAFVFHVFLDRAIFPPGIFGWVVYVPGFALLENIMLFVVLNLKWFRQKSDAAFVGVSIGAGMSATGAMALVFGAVANNSRAASEIFSPLGIFSIAGISVASTFIHTANGALLGIGSAKGLPWIHFGRAFIAYLPYGTMFMALYYAGIYYDMWLWVPLMLALVLYSHWVLRFIMRNSLPEFLPGELRKKLRRDRRRKSPDQ